ncbi:cytochrome c-type biogenesis protein CcmH [Litoreibacter ascidiaceicola]|uniref:Cytochrome c-type biogenesis protein n=1 Tax=Litoreibacter ascidiaceicola TaxID=1486859 RepID=A0A1M4V6F0_9RHOB|nr:cytochrome c-type biogenesis protein [Litoreibacter ascidiaceicola]SHE64453.1 cytochrome c-type biogenesis protein CcmH [Litoreibacter ascidiaceicola]
MIRAALVALALLASPAFAVEPDEVLSDPALEDRARAISANVRCVVCQNEPIDSSNAGVARDLRVLIRERLVAGDTDQEIYDFLVLRYGDFVLFKPPFKPSTYALWLGPFAILFIGGAAVAISLSRRPRRPATKDTHLSTKEETELAKLMEEDKSL